MEEIKTLVGIYDDSIISYFKENLGSVEVHGNNIIIPCPWCDISKPSRSKDHLWISLNDPIFRCWRGGCGARGYIDKLFKKIDNKSVEDFVEKTTIESFKEKKIIVKDIFHEIKIETPILRPEYFKVKKDYIERRLKYTNHPVTSIKGLVFDIYEFVNMNNITLNDRDSKMITILQNQFVGFLTENKSLLILRNTDEKSGFRYYKIKLHNQPLPFPDYYKLFGGDPDSKSVILAEGIFDILSEYIFDFSGLKFSSKL